jgi:molybdenum-dependent DNA-binding transcriptional regulator ModE
MSAERSPHQPNVIDALQPKRLEMLRAVAETGSLAQAAYRLDYSPSAVSQQLRKLERSLGVRLFERCARGVELTAAGYRLAYRAELIVDELRRAVANLAVAAAPVDEDEETAGGEVPRTRLRPDPLVVMIDRGAAALHLRVAEAIVRCGVLTAGAAACFVGTAAVAGEPVVDVAAAMHGISPVAIGFGASGTSAILRDLRSRGGGVVVVGERELRAASRERRRLRATRADSAVFAAVETEQTVLLIEAYVRSEHASPLVVERHVAVMRALALDACREATAVTVADAVLAAGVRSGPVSVPRS